MLLFLVVFSSAYHRHEAAIAIARNQIQIAPAHLSEAIAPSQCAPRFKDPLGKIYIFPSGSLKRGAHCEGAIASLKCAGAI